jgi:hypothetical protein
LLISLNGTSPELVAADDEQGVRTSALLVEPDGTALELIADLIDTGSLTVELDRCFPPRRDQGTRVRRTRTCLRENRPPGHRLNARWDTPILASEHTRRSDDQRL